MPLSDAALQHKAKYDAENFTTVQTRLPKATAEAFREYCRSNETTAHAVLKKFIEQCIRENT